MKLTAGPVVVLAASSITSVVLFPRPQLVADHVGQAMMNADRPNEVGTEALWEATRRVVQLLVAGRYDELAKLSGSQRLSADELRGAVQEYGVRLQVPPTPEAAQFDPIRIIGSEPPAWAIACDCGARARHPTSLLS